MEFLRGDWESGKPRLLLDQFQTMSLNSPEFSRITNQLPSPVDLSQKIIREGESNVVHRNSEEFRYKSLQFQR